MNRQHLTPEASAALKALSDLRVVRASWKHPGYRHLRHAGLAEGTGPPLSSHADHRLTPRGEDYLKEHNP